MQRRLYNRGYYIERAHHTASTAAPATRTTVALADSAAPVVPAVLAQHPVDTLRDTASRAARLRSTVKAFVKHPAQKIIAQVGPAAKVAKLALAQPPKKHHKLYKYSSARETVRDALILGLVADFVIGPLSALVMLYPDFVLRSSGGTSDHGGTIFIMSCPIISLVLTFFALRAIFKVAGALGHRAHGDTGTLVLGILAILLCLIACLIGVGTTIFLVAHPVIALIVGICALLTLLYLAIDAL
jgi:hypothetical protein